MPNDDELLRRLLHSCGDGSSPSALVAAALLSDRPDELMARAAERARTTRDRQLVAIAAAHLAGDEELLDALVRDHLADHPDNVLAAWIAAQHARAGEPADGNH